MAEYTEKQVEEMLREAVEKTEKSFGGTFKRLKSENEELLAKYETASGDYRKEKESLESRIGELETALFENNRHISELAVGGEIERQLRETGPLPERFIDRNAVEYSEDEETLKRNVSAVLERAREEFHQALASAGISVEKTGKPFPNPANPPSRDTKTASGLKRAEAREVLKNMTQRGLLR